MSTDFSESEQYFKGAEIIQKIPLIRVILAFCCKDLSTPIRMVQVCSAFREAIVDYSAAEVAWRALLSPPSSEKCDKSARIRALHFKSKFSAMLLHASKKNWPSWIIISLARAGAVYDEELLSRMLRPQKQQQKSATAKRVRMAVTPSYDNYGRVLGTSTQNLPPPPPQQASAAIAASTPNDDDNDDNDDADDEGAVEEVVMTDVKGAESASDVEDDDVVHVRGTAAQNKDTADSNAKIEPLFKLRVDFSCTEERDNKNYFHYLAHFGRADCVQVLLELKSADPTSKTAFGKTPLHFAAMSRDKENGPKIVQMLLESIPLDKRSLYADLEDSQAHKTALFWAVARGMPKSVEILITVGKATVDLSNEIDDDRPIHLAAQLGDVESLRVLIKIGNADINGKGIKSQTPLMSAVVHGKVEAARFLLENGASPNAVDFNHSTALHRACRQVEVEIAKLLLVDFRADRTLLDSNNRTAEQVMEKTNVFTDKMKRDKEAILEMLRK